MRRILTVSSLAALAASLPAQLDPQLASPFAALAGGQVINLDDLGHAAPAFADIDGDGLKDLLVGRFGKDESKGALSIYKNVGTAKDPKFQAPSFFQAGGTTGRVPVG